MISNIEIFAASHMTYEARNNKHYDSPLSLRSADLPEAERSRWVKEVNAISRACNCTGYSRQARNKHSKTVSPTLLCFSGGEWLRVGLVLV